MFEQGGFRVREERGIPGPFALVFGDGIVGRAIGSHQQLLVRIARGLFSYQMFFVVEPLPSLEYLLQTARDESAAPQRDRGTPRAGPAASLTGRTCRRSRCDVNDSRLTVVRSGLPLPRAAPGEVVMSDDELRALVLDGRRAARDRALSRRRA